MAAPVAIIDGEERAIAPLTRRHMEALADAGTLESLGRFELIDGVPVHMSPAKSPHGLVQSRIIVHLAGIIPDTLDIGTDIGVFFGDVTMRAPDICLCAKGVEPGFLAPQDIALAIEIADTTRADDLDGKARLYASAGLPEYWVVDLAGRATHRHRAPAGDRYDDIEIVGWSAPIAPLCAPEAPFRVEDVLKGVRL